jgi:hypothetical protein
MSNNPSFPNVIKIEFYNLKCGEFKYSEDLILVGGEPEGCAVYKSSELSVACVIFDGTINISVTDIKSGVDGSYDMPMRGNYAVTSNLIACVSGALNKMSRSSVN